MRPTKQARRILSLGPHPSPSRLSPVTQQVQVRSCWGRRRACSDFPLRHLTQGFHRAFPLQVWGHHAKASRFPGAYARFRLSIRHSSAANPPDQTPLTRGERRFLIARRRTVALNTAFMRALLGSLFATSRYERGQILMPGVCRGLLARKWLR